MTCYKLVTCEFKWFGLQNKVENLIQSVSCRAAVVLDAIWRIDGAKLDEFTKLSQKI